jgi:flagellar M-ring protein FliF
MSAAKKATDSLRNALGALTTTHKLLAGCLAVILVMALVLVAVLNASPQMVELMPGASAAEAQTAQNVLTESGFKVRPEGGRLMIAAADAPRARAVLAQAGATPQDKATYFESLIARTDWMNSRQVNERNYFIALQNELSRTISGFRGVRNATVQLSVPESAGLGRSAKRPTASVAIASETGAALPQGVVDAAARFVAGSIAGLSLESVQIIDSAVGKPRVVSTEESAGSGYATEQAQRVEELTRRKVEDLLAYIPGVMVAVTASVDVTRSVSETQEYLPDKKGTVRVEKKKTESSTVTTEATPSASPGFTANQTADIDRGSGGSGSGSQTTDETTEYENHVGSRTERVVDPRGQSTSVAVSVNVPSGYVSRLLRDAAAPADPAAAAPSAAPTQQDIASKFDKEVKPQIVATLLPHVRAMVAAANPAADPKQVQDFITVSLIPVQIVDAPGVQAAGMLGALGGGLSGGSGSFSLGAGIVDKAVLGVLAFAAIGMMVMMLRRTGQRTVLPSAEELVGKPPSIDATADVIGEVEESETAMPGIELGEDEMQAQKVQEQVAEMIMKDPQAASRLLGRWVQVED